MKKIFNQKILFVFFALFIGYCSSVQAGFFDHSNNKDATDSTTQNQQLNLKPADFSNINLMFLLSAQSAVVTPSSDEPGVLQITLSQANPYMTYLSERPYRLKGIVPTSRFLNAWAVGENSFQANNPNAVIMANQINGVENTSLQPILVSLSNPSYNENQGTVQFTVRPLLAENFLIKQTALNYLTIIINS